MIGTSRVVKVWAYARPADLRKGYNGLFGLVQQELLRDPMSGEMFIFVNRRRTSCKVLFWDGTGLCLFCKRLEQGLFAKFWRRGETSEPIALTSAELTLFIEGCELVGRRQLSPKKAAHDPLLVIDVCDRMASWTCGARRHRAASRS